MKVIILFFSLILSTSSFAQQIIVGKVQSITNGQKVSQVSLRIDKKAIIGADTNGVFEIRTTKRKVRINIIPENVYRFDTLLLTSVVRDTLRLFIPHPIDSALAEYDLAHGLVRFFCGGGYAPMASRSSDKIFEQKYSVKYHMLDCMMPVQNGLITYDQRVASYLDAKYGTAWRQTVRPDVFGIPNKDYRYD